MPFQFRWLCDLLEELDSNRHRGRLSTARVQSFENQIVNAWYQRFSHKIDRTGPSAIAFLSCILPERRPDRVYNLRAKRLSQIFGRSLSLGSTRASELNQWQNQGGADFATCVELTLRKCENAKPVPGREVTLEEIDEALDLIAAHSVSSSPAIRAKRTNPSASDLLSPILRRLQSNEAKWLARMILKSYAPVQVPEYQALHAFHFMLPNLLAIQNSFEAATATLATEAIRQLPARPEKNYEYALQSLVSTHVKPCVGTMIKRQPYHKARSIKNCCSLANGRQMSVERKYDGEHCQIHVDISRGDDCIQIFSKSGKDSTNDRIRLHTAIKDALRIGRNGCRIRHHCIIEGELLVWSTTHKQIQPFHKVRKYVKHGGREIGTAQDSPQRPGEHLMVAFYDILVLDDYLLLNKAHKVRRQYLKMVLQTMEGRAILGERKVIDFRANRPDKKLREFFAQAITQRWEGLVLKGSNEPYFSWNKTNHGIKLKKDYITKLGDEADLCIVGGRRDSHVELQIGLGDLKWTTFYVGAVCNMESMRRYDTKPQIKIIDILTHHSMPNAELLDFNRLGQLVNVEYDSDIPEFDVEFGHFGMEKPTDLFKKPFVVEIMGAGYEKLSNSSFYTLRFPRKIDRGVRLHTDRSLLETTSFSELQEMADTSMGVPEDKDSQEDAQWIEKLVQADGKRPIHESASQTTTSARTPPSAVYLNSSLGSLEGKLSSPVFVRPDTEESETQMSSQGMTSLQDSRASGNKVFSSHSSVASANSQLQVNKRTTRVLSFANSNDTAQKRQRLNNNASMFEEANAIRLSMSTNPAVSSRKHRGNATQVAAVNQDVVAIAVGSTKMEHSVLNPEQTEAVNIPEAWVDAPDCTTTTPDSMLVVRQILAFDDRLDNHSINLSTTMRLGKDSSLIVRESTAQNPRQRADANTVYLPTPPRSSPTMGCGKDKGPQYTGATNPHTVGNTSQQQHVIASMPTSSTDPSGHLHVPATSPSSTAPKVLTMSAKEETRKHDQPLHNTSPILMFNLQTILETALTDIHATFTFSPVHFLSHIDASTATPPTIEHARTEYSIILVDSLTPELAADALEDMAHKIQSHVQSENSDIDIEGQLDRYNNKIIVFDIRVLQHEDVVKAGGNFTLQVLKGLDFRRGYGRDAALFCGILRLYTRQLNLSATTGSTERKQDLKIGLKLDYAFDWMC